MKINSLNPAVVFLACFLSALAVVAHCEPGAIDKSKFMTVEEIRPGMEGIGKTVFSEGKIESFDVKIIGVMKNAFAKGDMILAELSSDWLIDIGVVGGMSGSPVYIDERLIGAVAYGWMFSKKPIAGITPIVDMLRVFDQTDRVGEPAKPAPMRIRRSGAGEGSVLGNFEGAMMGHALPYTKSIRIDASGMSDFDSAYAFPNSFDLEPLSTPLFMSHCSPSLLPIVKKLFEEYNMTPVISGSASAEERAADIPFEPGAALGIQLLKGDLDFSAIGTLTYRDGDRIIGFGHTMYNGGAVEYPMAKALIRTVVPSMMRPFKLGVTLDTIGTVNQDRQPAIGGIVGKIPAMIPINVEVHDEQTGINNIYHFQAIDHRRLTPRITMIALLESVLASSREGGDFTVMYDYTIKLKGLPDIQKSQFFSDDINLPFVVSFPVLVDMNALMYNRFEEVEIEEVDFTVRVKDEVRISEIVGVRMNKNKYKPGDEIVATIHLQPFRQNIERVKMSLQLPDDIREGVYQFVITDRGGKQIIDEDRAPGLSTPSNIRQLIAQINRNYLRNTIYAQLHESKTGMTVSGEELPSLPPSILNAMFSNTLRGFTQPTKGTIIAENTLITDSSIYGSYVTTISVEE